MRSNSDLEAFLAKLVERGVTVRVVDGAVKVRGWNRLVPSDQRALREARGELRALLTSSNRETGTAGASEPEAEREIAEQSPSASTYRPLRSVGPPRTTWAQPRASLAEGQVVGARKVGGRWIPSRWTPVHDVTGGAASPGGHPTDDDRGPAELERSPERPSPPDIERQPNRVERKPPAQPRECTQQVRRTQ